VGRPTAEVERIAAEALGAAPADVRPAGEGYGNEAWRLTGGDGRSYVLKLGPRSSAAKWASSHEALAVARDVGVPVPELVHTAEADGRVARVLTWIDGTPASEAALDDAQVDRLIAALGAAVGALHGSAAGGFSSRLDGSAPTFATWRDYLAHRMVEIAGRCEASGAVDPVLVERVGREVARLADEVDDVCEPVVCHRDLHLGNLIVDADGTLVGIIDWDAAEPWDRAGDWFKLEYEVLHAHPDRADALLRAYLDGGPVPPHWPERRRIVHLIEALNTLPNADERGWDDAFAERARRHLDDLLADPV